MKCDLNCLPSYWPTERRCCQNCAEAYRDFYRNRGFSEEDINLIMSCWDDKVGFWGSNGCRLPRNLMPKKCLEWSCKDDIFVCTYRFVKDHPKYKGWIRERAYNFPRTPLGCEALNIFGEIASLKEKPIADVLDNIIKRLKALKT